MRYHYHLILPKVTFIRIACQYKPREQEYYFLSSQVRGHQAFGEGAAWLTAVDRE